jgi:hypothetical protein
MLATGLHGTSKPRSPSPTRSPKITIQTGNRSQMFRYGPVLVLARLETSYRDGAPSFSDAQQAGDVSPGARAAR